MMHGYLFDLNSISSVRPFPKWMLFSVGVFTTVEGDSHWDENNSTGVLTIHIKL